MNVIAIADSHTLCREALCDYMRHADKDLIVEGFGDYSSLKSRMRDGNPPDLILIDKDMAGFDEGAFNTDFSNPGKAPKIGMIVSLFNGSVYFDPSVHGVFSKGLSCKMFLSGIYEILSGRTFFPAFDESIRIQASDMALYQPQKDFGFTPREKETLGYLVKGASNKDIARALDLQVVTVKLHVRGICRKMKAANRTQAALIAKENGWG